MRIKAGVQIKLPKKNPSIFSYACILIERISHLDDYLAGMHGNGSYKYQRAMHNPTGHALMDLDALLCQNFKV